MLPEPVTGPHVVLTLHYLCLALLAILGVHRLWMMILLRSAPPAPPPPPEPAQWPPVLVQLPVYNESAVVGRLLHACSQLDYSRKLLTIQVLDDSTDDTTALIRDEIARLAETEPSLRIDHVRREERTGFKAGALAHGLAQSDQPVVALFDADFVPPPDFLRRTIPHLLAGERIAYVQAAWEFLNGAESTLTEAQATLLDAHFHGEHAARSAHGFPFNFNGTAGVWRRAAIDEAGGWTGDTLTEDLDLSYRTWMAGWEARFCSDIRVPSELPATWRSLRGQQYRWSRGTLQCTRKLLLPLWRSPLPLAVRAEATFPLLANLAWPLLVLLMALAMPVFFVRQEHELHTLFVVDLLILIPATLSFFAWFFGIQRRLGRPPGRAALRALLALLMGIGLAVNNARAALAGLLPATGVFLRTPKGKKAQSEEASPPPPGETLLALILMLLVVAVLSSGVYTALPFTLLFAAGCVWAACG